MQSAVDDHSFIDKTGSRIVLACAVGRHGRGEPSRPPQIEAGGKEAAFDPVEAAAPAPASVFKLSPVKPGEGEMLPRSWDRRRAGVMVCVLLSFTTIAAGRIGNDSAVAKALIPRTEISEAAVLPSAGPPAAHDAIAPPTVPLSAASGPVVAVASVAAQESAAAPVDAPATAIPLTQPDSVMPADPEPAAQDSRLAELFARRGDHLLAQRNALEARKYYWFAAKAGSARGARALARTYDPVVLARLRLTEVQPDPGLADFWARRAGILGEPTTLAQLEAPTGRPRSRPHPVPAP